MTFSRRFRVHWSDCDPARIVFHPHFIRWMDEGFTDLVFARGLDFVRMAAEDPDFRGSPLVDVTCAFRAPARFGDTLEHRIAAPVFGSGRAYTLAHGFHLGDTLVAEGSQTRIWGRADAAGRLRAVAIPDAVRAALTGEET